MSKSDRTAFVVTLAFGLCVTETALAESPTRAAATEDGDYSYRFSDEDLLGESLNGIGDMFRLLPKRPRIMLIRPRTSFVQAIMKSAENL